MQYKKEKRDRKDKCNICGRTLDLTWDHVPPKFANNSTAKNYDTVFGLSRTSEKIMPLTAQNGIKYRSICADCNNRLLGAETDPSYKELTNTLLSSLSGEQRLPQKFAVEVSINRLSRSIVGHFLSAKNFYDDQCTVDIALREYFMNLESLPPRDMELLYFLYPYTIIQIVRDVVPVNACQNRNLFPDGMSSCMYSFPVAFLLTDSYQCLGLHNLFEYCTTRIDDRVEIPFDSNSLFYPETDMKIPRHPLWPCNIGNDIHSAQGVFGGMSVKDGIIAKNK